MMKNTILLLLCLIFGFSYSQKTKQITKQNIDREMAATQDPFADQNKKLDLLLKINKDSKDINYTEGIINSGKRIMVIYYAIGENEKAIEYTYQVEKEARKINDYVSLAAAYIERGTVHSALGLADENYRDLQQALPYVQKYTDTNKKHYDMSLIYQGLAAGYYIPKQAHQDTILSYLKKSLKEVSLITDNKEDERQTDEKYDMISYLNMNIGMFYTGIYKPQKLELAEVYLKNSLKAIEDRKFTKLKVSKIPILNSLGRFYSEQNRHKEALPYAEEVLKLERSEKSPQERMLAYATITNSYEGLKEKDSTIKYMSLYTNLSDSLNHINKLNADNVMKKITSKQDKVHKDNELQIILISVAVFLFLMAGCWILWKKNQKKLHKSYEMLIHNLKKANESSVQNIQQEVSSEKSINITDETVNMILAKLEKFEKSQKFIKKDLSLTSLANDLNTNTRYLSEIIKQYKESNYNNYINGLRINYITNKLYENPIYREYKISYLAEACGFSSREVFAVIFKKETGVSPSYFINNLKKDSLESAS